jgi:hypothetical protein
VRGGERTRTADFYVANVALYQLSYTPGCPLRIAPGADLPFLLLIPALPSTRRR